MDFSKLMVTILMVIAMMMMMVIIIMMEWKSKITKECMNDENEEKTYVDKQTDGKSFKKLLSMFEFDSRQSE